MRFYHSIILALVAGIVMGVLVPSWYPLFDPLGLLFIQSLKLIMIPLVYASLVTGAVQLGQSMQLGRLGLGSLVYFGVSSAAASVLGLLAIRIAQPGQWVAVSVESSVAMANPVTPTVTDLLLRIVPDNPIQAIADGQMLSIIFMGLIFGLAIGKLGKKAEPMYAVIKSLGAIMTLVTRWVIAVSPLGIFALMMKLVVTTGLETLVPLVGYMGVVMVALAVHALCVLPVIVSVLARRSPMALARQQVSALITAFSTATSSGALPIVLESFTDPKEHRVASFVMPIGTTVNMNGTAVYVAGTVAFLAQYYGVALGPSQYGILISLTVLSAVSAAGIPGSSLVTMSLALAALGIPLEGIGMIVAVDRVLDMSRTAVNVWGNAVATVVMTRLAD
ncbi:MAG: dicarboxylate/amino acid:cation symporter [Candidatus Marinamargulisbacteria bacterium]|nr:dicarboxylate/amino acid:cation symporter [Candidatus Marinamargulisbacteria bacterium]